MIPVLTGHPCRPVNTGDSTVLNLNIHLLNVFILLKFYVRESDLQDAFVFAN